jgi:RNA polymerase sigma-70 factor (ECF subfamily)
MIINSSVSYSPSAVYTSQWESQKKEDTLNKQQLNIFLRDVERRAFRMAMIATQQSDEAMDIVQDAMIRLAQSYGHKPQAEWNPLFYRILHNRIMDWHRRKKVENSLLRWLPGKKNEAESNDLSIDDCADTSANPEDIHRGRSTLQQLEQELHRLPPRQRQAFLLRSWEGLSVAETATIMGCSEGSVKTHYSRALNSLKENLGEHWP